ncbi:hypothetical protein [Pseudoalteromonas ruthenica]|uniref:hypothetical protein n=2 Tax=Pseudoalteromonas ruthenica TaxID=151081 RepID=UPI00110A0F6A|nr:hypothetical protein [Pseudoalteromonas ruthenica]TMO49910.1 hypothetical protein CWC24_00375 [Pseudoalteromonas ruthenica]TMO50588.1 hypothetical protein CWC23_10855 [Pseudoalteromonas ruthenica]
MIVNMEGLINVLFIVFMPLSMLMTVIFQRVSVAYINKCMKSDGVYPPSWDKGLGGSGPFYVCAIFFKRGRIPTPLFDGHLVPKYARTIDKILAGIYLFSAIGFGITVVLIAYFDPY